MRPSGSRAALPTVRDTGLHVDDENNDSIAPNAPPAPQSVPQKAELPPDSTEASNTEPPSTTDLPPPAYPVRAEAVIHPVEMDRCEAIDKAKVKTVLCINFMHRRRCPFGSHCAFAHGEGELRAPLAEMLQKKADAEEKKWQRQQAFEAAQRAQPPLPPPPPLPAVTPPGPQATWTRGRGHNGRRGGRGRPPPPMYEKISAPPYAPPGAGEGGGQWSGPPAASMPLPVDLPPPPPAPVTPDEAIPPYEPPVAAPPARRQPQYRQPYGQALQQSRRGNAAVRRNELYTRRESNSAVTESAPLVATDECSVSSAAAGPAPMPPTPPHSHRIRRRPPA